MLIINKSPPIYHNNSNIESLPSYEFYILIFISSLLFICFTICCFQLNSYRNINIVNNEIRSRESTIDIINDNNKTITDINLDNSNLSDDDELPSYNEIIKNS